MISVIVPVIKPEKAERCFAAIKEHASMPYELVTAVDEQRVGCPEMVKHLTKQAKNDWVMFLGDDTIPQKGFMEEAWNKTDVFPEARGMVGLNDQHQNGDIVATHWLCHKAMLMHTGGEFFHTGYKTPVL